MDLFIFKKKGPSFSPLQTITGCIRSSWRPRVAVGDSPGSLSRRRRVMSTAAAEVVIPGPPKMIHGLSLVNDG